MLTDGNRPRIVDRIGQSASSDRPQKKSGFGEHLSAISGISISPARVALWYMEEPLEPSFCLVPFASVLVIHSDLALFPNPLRESAWVEVPFNFTSLRKLIPFPSRLLSAFQNRLATKTETEGTQKLSCCQRRRKKKCIPPEAGSPICQNKK